MIIQSGVIIFLGLIFMGFKLKPKHSLRCLGRPLLLDVAVFFITFVMHYGTFSGVMAAAVAALMTSAFCSLMIWLFGYIRNNKYYPGKVFKLKAEIYS